MLEKIAELIKGAHSSEIALERVVVAGFSVKVQSRSAFRIIEGDLMVLELWGGKVILRGIDHEGEVNEIVTYCNYGTLV